MNATRSRVLAGAAAGLTLLGAMSSAVADDTEIFQNTTSVPANIMLVLDTSGSMNDAITTRPTYDPGTTYGGSCDADAIYYSTNGKPPGCTSSNKFAASNLKCAAATTPLGAVGKYTNDFIQWRRSSSTYRWRKGLNSSATAGYVECAADAGASGDGVDSSKLYPTSGTSSGGSANTTGIWVASGASGSNCWVSSGCPEGSGGTGYTIFAANYVNYWNDASLQTTSTKFAVMQSAAKSFLDSVSNTNVGLMRYSSDGSGGMVTWPVGPISSNRDGMKAQLDSWEADGNTPLSETLFEAYRYFVGGKVRFGDASVAYQSSACDRWGNNCRVPMPSVATSRSASDSTVYDSPSDYSCMSNFLIYLTDGMPVSDNEANGAIKALDLASINASCTNATNGACLVALSKYMYAGPDLRPDVPGKQNVTSYWIGFGTEFTGSTQNLGMLNDAANAGGSGAAYGADSLDDLSTVFTNIFMNVQKINTMISAPAVAVNAFNRTQTLDDVYVSVFSPKGTFGWPGNVKRYKISDGVVKDVNGADAVSSTTGFFNDAAQSYWSAAVDGSNVTLGGAASRLPDPASRIIYTYIGSNSAGPVSLKGAGDNYLLSMANSGLDGVLGLGTPGDPSKADLINWARGVDVKDENNDGSLADARHAMGDPIHSAPAVVVYDKGSGGAEDDAVVYSVTNDGYLHAFNAATGVELWSFVPQEMLPRLRSLYRNKAVSHKQYGLDGAIRILKYDINGDGKVDAAAGDRVIVFFSTGRNADVSRYYAMDVTAKDGPKFLWAVGPTELPGLGQAWSEPVIARVNISGATQNSQKLVLIIGGGYDSVEDGYDFVSSGDSVGNHLYMVDALKGGPALWSAGPSGSDNLNAAQMSHAIPSSVAVLDIDNDGYADRMYVGDMAAQLWRFDITNGNAAGSLVKGGVIASLGTKLDTTHTRAENRRFYSPPDVAAIQKPGIQPFLNIAIGSGYRGHPLNQETQDRFYAVRDYAPFTPIDDYSLITVARDALSGASAGKLVDITDSLTPTMPSGALGWQLNLGHDGAWIGEKVLVPARTFSNQVMFTTYTPVATVSTDPCAGIGSGTNRVYSISVLDGAPHIDLNKDGSLTMADRSVDLSQGGIAPETAFLFPATKVDDGDGDGSAGDGGDDNGGTGSGRPAVVCLSGVEVLSVCTDFNQRRKTFWREGSAN